MNIHERITEINSTLMELNNKDDAIFYVLVYLK